MTQPPYSAAAPPPPDPPPVQAHKPCPAHPGYENVLAHECMADERRCVYCGANIEPTQCNGCGRFMSCHELREYESRCEECA